ncbi:helix-turn-helix domain-containing protein [Paenibacillus polysaccharolyticus]|uniref:helix-turn-helix domain-containing protein n=1 Tax=Paenibacillus polysaccharolyticus TaxID=582692 RepID=UPI0020403C5E|nr:helix-turn-helix transcriptional regulator [Paenibacillus polysaccharolyticus]MCM3134387.1 helix-turn-helix domain-containing protein [Paenibacillus polysaccharolyticus]
MTKLRNSVGERIREIRKAKGLTQQQLAELSGLDDAYIGSVERGERNFSIDTLEKILKGLDTSAHDLLYDPISTTHTSDFVQSKREAVDEYGIILSQLNIQQHTALRKILNEIKDAFL